MNRNDYLEVIRNNIQRSGYHLYSISTSPNEFSYLYTIGLTEKFGFELITAGWLIFDRESKILIIQMIIEKLTENSGNIVNQNDFFIGDISVDGIRTSLSVNFGEVTDFWMDNLMDGAIDYYSNKKVKAFQILPTLEKYDAITIPDMSISKVDKNHSKAWQYYFEEYEYSNKPYEFDVDEKVLQGAPILEIVNFNGTNWQALSYHSGYEENNPKIYTISLCTILAIEPQIEKVLNLEAGEWLRRKSQASDWSK